MQQATSSAPLLVIRGLVVEGRSDQGVSQIIQTMDLTLERGKVLGLIGESGAGKSTPAPSYLTAPIWRRPTKTHAGIFVAPASPMWRNRQRRRSTRHCG